MAFIDLLILTLASADLAETTAAKDDLSSEPPGLVGGEKGSDQPDVLRHAGPTERSQRLDRVCDLLVSLHGTRALGVDYARVDELTRMFCGPSSFASTRVIPFTALFVAA